MRVLITGGAGFLGSALANHLLEEGHAVRVLDDLSSGDRRLLQPGIAFTSGDVRDVARLWTLLQDVDVVYHLAARVSVQESVLYPIEYNAVNTGGTVSLMTASRDAGVRRVVLASSGTVYGDQAEQPISEGAWPRPPNPYAVSKLAAEGYVESIGRLYHIETVVLRIFNAYGPNQPGPPGHSSVIPLFLQEALRGGTQVIHGTGEQTRDFVYVTDVVSALRQSALLSGVSGLINVGSGVETSVNDLVSLVGSATGKETNSVRMPEQGGGVSRMRADIRRARELLDWQPRVRLEQGLAELVRHYLGQA